MLNPRLVAAALVALLATADARSVAADAPLPAPGDVKALAIHPQKVSLIGADSATQLVLTATLNDGRVVDLTHDAKYAVADGKAATVLPTGRVLPRVNGTTEIVATYGDKTARVPLGVTHMGDDLPLNFTNQVVPIFTKLGCNSGGCHGKLAGQNGFRLSLLGFEPDLDFTTLVKEGRGRRMFPANPDASLFLTKATGRSPHGGGKKMEPDSDEYKLVRRWIGAGMPWGTEKDPTVTKITVFPEHRVMSRGTKQQFAVYAHYTDGTVEDISRRAQYECNDTEIATVDANGLVRTLEMSGEAAVMARYQGMVAVFRATVPLGVKTPEWNFAAKTVVDQHTQKKWRELGLVPSDLCTDEVFIRRVFLDVTGTLPTPKQVTDFVADKDAAKRDKLVDRLLESPEYAYFFANKWADILRVKRRQEQTRAAGTFAFHEWIREQVAADTPYSEFVRGVVTATGDERKSPPTVWYKEIDKPEQFVDDVSQVFLGQRMACANCHHHPYEKWGQDDYWGLAAFYGRVGRKNLPVPGATDNNKQLQVVFSKAAGNVTNKRTGKSAELKPLDAAPMDVSAEDDPRQKLVDWMVDPKNPYFARTVANRYWAHFFGRGIVDPLDDMRITNPPSNPELLDALAKNLVDNKYSLKALVKTICKSRTYQLSSTPNDFNKADKQAYARYYPKRLQAEVLLDALCQATDSPSRFGGLPADKNAPTRAIMLPDESFSSYFLDVNGRPQRISACECERVNEANLAAVLHMLNSDEVQGKITRAGGRADKLASAADKRPDAEKVEELFLWVLCRKPTADDLKAALAHVEQQAAKNPTNPAAGMKTAYENITWALVNTKEFVFNQ
ncbi:Ig-like domain-containing protein OS=Singulisphaera acidiphila (strain ATCC BAA-1392 / DSM 18658 / VKM B-2454 / MOB10) GN=Sinac_3078 PE=4 SV=1: Big_2: PSCyt2: PSD1 [Gemmataceae bacterium]|nr:Ig-like domain-containing protein OS=Singulisphaera acidiphila (strain ATCC BAA-1392 / DSM 18658 / VKM B-2454 / MOB10) GN=Sinac_3078 PE=4 SV=1: Big_2: PSCyt2: PSD1 [Gemmataceae bacterium]VTU02019.1 Ig-like domain-containing protein OS=Singulisphaera acidiphila (strain ATCC BAA-1392 / DSM 18658 / VKM B-2454 / MOB10) GN=Sinac_3078 PE=4 SV=1: Big_2: PSCyt2: PSD1 [Gemmataceae bacterium]